MRALFVVEGGYRAGLGHLVRSRVLAAELCLLGHQVDLLLYGSAESLVGRPWPAAPVAVISEDEPVAAVCSAAADLCASRGYDWLIVDGYSFAGEALPALAGVKSPRILAFDDVAGRELAVDVILNQNTRSPDAYRDAPVRAGRLLLGPEYALVDGCYRQHRRPRPPESLRKVLVSFGGVDRRGRTLRAVELLDQAPMDLSVEVVIGPYFPFRDALAGRRGRQNLRLHENLPDLAELMAGCDLMISAGGSTVWQACCVGIPLLVLQTVDNQQNIIDTLGASGAALCADAARHPEYQAGIDGEEFAGLLARGADLATRAALFHEAQQLVDGQGARRVADVLREGI